VHLSLVANFFVCKTHILGFFGQQTIFSQKNQPSSHSFSDDGQTFSLGQISKFDLWPISTGYILICPAEDKFQQMHSTSDHNFNSILVPSCEECYQMIK